jgi:CRISPR-associated protein Csd1
MKLDPMNNNIGYRLGRLFATLEKIQLEANPGIDNTFRRIHYGMAMSRPVTAFGELMNLSKEQLAKIQDAALRTSLEKLLADIAEYTRDYPAFLNMSDQSMFTAGYNKQNQDFEARIFE